MDDEETERRLLSVTGVALRVYDDLRACVRAFNDLDTAAVEKPRLQARFDTLEGVFGLIDEELHHFVAVGACRPLTPLLLELAREDQLWAIPD